ncbi:hypothetical protein [Roseovarius dicentrarchi]|uniref:hypothetical protein n=1 Tax=Roseovarius dicentrarchi TaxID=2250573 RepID=UPI000DE8ED4B|nr:hypothetical protein [Roseovarius dicentrarchi]
MSDLQKLKQVTEAAYQAEQAKLQDILQQEGDLRQALAELDDRRSSAQSLPPDQLAAPRAIGADLLWQGWAQRTRQDLNMRLARVLVSKADRMAAMTRAFGRAEVVKSLQTDQKTARRKEALDRAQRADEALALLRAYNS